MCTSQESGVSKDKKGGRSIHDSETLSERAVAPALGSQGQLTGACDDIGMESEDTLLRSLKHFLALRRRFLEFEALLEV